MQLPNVSTTSRFAIDTAKVASWVLTTKIQNNFLRNVSVHLKRFYKCMWVICREIIGNVSVHLKRFYKCMWVICREIIGKTYTLSVVPNLSKQL
nr:unnamed protein product [Callosobruchus chinensis]